MKTLRLPVSGGFAAVVGAVGMLLCLAGGAAGQQAASDLWIPVTFYDFHSDRSNPEFEQPHTGGRSTGMVQALLDEDGKPQAVVKAAGATSTLEQGIRFWFRDWSALDKYNMSGKADPNASGHTYLEKFRPIYTYGSNGLLPPNVASAPRNGVDEWNGSVRFRKRAYADADFTFSDNYGSVTITENKSIDSAYTNKVIPAHLRFRLKQGTNGVYEFTKLGDKGAGFFPLTGGTGGTLYDVNYDGGQDKGEVGFCRENNCPGGTRPTRLQDNNWASTGTKNYNLSFTMEMAYPFKMGPSLTFEFTGDDDVWLFINGRLVNQIDIGGIHKAVTDRVDLDVLKGMSGNPYNLHDGEKADFHFFYAERHSDDSNIKITTNIVNQILTNMDLVVQGDTMVAGEKELARGIVNTDEGKLADFSKGSFTWSAKDIGPTKNGVGVGGPAIKVESARTNVTLAKTDSIWVTAERAYTYVRIYGAYYDSTTGKTVRDSADVWVAPGPAAQVSIEATDARSSGNTWAVTKLDTIRIQSTATADSNFYAILRDKFGNWIGPAATGPTLQGRTITWKTASETIAVGAAASETARGRGKATRVANSGNTPITVTYFIPGAAAGTGTFTGTSVVKLENVTYNAIQVGIKLPDGTFKPLSSSTDPTHPGEVKMVVGNDTTLYVMAQRSDNSKWEEVPASWLAGGLTTQSPPPSGTSISWNFTPTAATPVSTPGTVTVSISGGPSAKVNVIVEFRDPVAARFFIKSGQPSFDSVITIYRDEKSGKARMYAIPNYNVELIAGVRMPIVGQLFSNTVVSVDSWLSNNTSGTWTWANVLGSPSTDNCNNCGVRVENPSLKGDSATFMSTVAHNTYQIRGTYRDNARNITITQDIWIRVIPDASKPVLVIEPNSQGMINSPNAPQRVGEVIFTESDTTKLVYAVIRDTYGNFICFSGAPNLYPPPAGGGTTDWVARSAIVTLEAGYDLWGEEKIVRGDHADGSQTIVAATNSAWGNVKDSVKVIFRGYDYTSIEIVTKCASGQTPWFTIGGVPYCDIVGTLDMNSNQDTTLFVFGKRNDCDVPNGVTGNACWESIDGNWSRDAGLTSALTSPPNGTGSWTLSPTSSGTGQIVVSRPGSDMSDTIDVYIRVGPPLRAELEILTPADQLIAGKDISAKVNYYNRAGLMSEWDPSWNPTKGSLFADTLGLGGTTVKPLVKSERGSQELCYQGSGCQPGVSINAALPHSPTSLNDVVTFVIYYAADGHQIRYTESITVKLDGPLTALSPPFTVKAGEPAKIVIEGPGVANDSLKVSQGDPEQILHAVAYDDYGNMIGDYSGNWTATVPIPVDVKDRPIIVYVPGMAEDNDAGPLCVKAVTASGRELHNCITVVLTGVTARPLSAVTKDDDGCGFLDKIVLKFKKPITFAGGDEVAKVKPGADKITVNYSAKNFSWTVDSVTVRTSDSTVTIWLEDKAPHSGATQTGWTPVVNIVAKDFFDEAGAQSIQTTDGAPPVIAAAKLYFPKESTGKVEENYIEVTFSEKVKSSDGTAFGVNKNEANTKFPPAELFNIWVRGGQNLAKAARTRALSKKANDQYDKSQFDVQKDRLLNISRTIYMDESTLRFYLENKMEISPPNDYINIRTQDTDKFPNKNPNNLTVVRDVPDNVPLANNRLVPITFGNEPGGNMRAIPNPASPDPNRTRKDGQKVGAGTIYATHDEGAIQDIRDGRYGGTVFEVPVYVPTSGTVKCQLKVYDLAGNLVIAGESENAANGMETGYSKMHLYWNGYNSKKMKVAPGTYRMVVYISYSNLGKNDENAKNKKYQGLVGMSK